jgi:hypothetical protein
MTVSSPFATQRAHLTIISRSLPISEQARQKALRRRNADKFFVPASDLRKTMDK